MNAESKWFWSVDWGTSNLRISLANWEDGEVKERYEHDLGVLRLYQKWQAAGSPERTAYFLSALADFIPAPKDISLIGKRPIVISGMASASIGIEELAYAQGPFGLSGEGVVSKWILKNVLLISGLEIDAELMRGEETQALGLDIVGEKELVLMMPGTHSKHIHIADASINAFKTVMTGELFGLLSQHSILKDSLQGGQAFDEVAFENGLRQSTQDPISANLFAVRSGDLLGLRSKSSNADYLSGLLIGAECQMLESEQVILVARDSLRERYLKAIQYLKPEIEIKALSVKESEQLVIDGQRKILRRQIAPGLS